MRTQTTFFPALFGAFLSAFIVTACAHMDANALHSEACRRVEQAWPHIVADTEASMRAPDENASRATLDKVQGELQDPVFDQCAAWGDTVAMQRATVGEFREVYAIFHAADDGADGNNIYGELGRDKVIAGYVKMHDDACTDAGTHMHAAWSAWDANAPVEVRKQRYLSNVERDDYLIKRDGSLGAPANGHDFVPLVQTPVLDTLSPAFTSLQGQGPMAPQDANTYANAAMRYAAAHHIDRVTFVNTAGGQVPAFGDAVRAASGATGVLGTYIQYDGWRDGTLVGAKDAAMYAARVAEDLDPLTSKGGTTMLVVNCNAGMDRSGTINVLVQLILQARHNLAHGMDAPTARAQGLAAIPTIVHNIKLARPRAISSIPRYLFLYQAYNAYWDTLKK